MLFYSKLTRFEFDSQLLNRAITKQMVPNYTIQTTEIISKYL